MLRQIARPQHRRSTFLSRMLTDQRIASCQRGTPNVNSRSDAGKSSSHLRKWLPIDATHAIRVVNSEDWLRTTVGFELDLGPWATR